MRTVDFEDTSGAVRETVWQLYETSFPAHERRSRTAQEKAFADGRARSKVMLDDDGEVTALMFYWLHADMVYVEFLAVNPAMRGRNIGSGVVERLLELHPGKLVILEIEPPQEETAVRRLRFYERLGFVRNPYDYIHPSYRRGADACPHELVLMSHGRIATEEEFSGFTEFMRETVWEYAD